MREFWSTRSVASVQNWSRTYYLKNDRYSICLIFLKRDPLTWKSDFSVLNLWNRYASSVMADFQKSTQQTKWVFTPQKLVSCFPFHLMFCFYLLGFFWLGFMRPSCEIDCDIIWFFCFINYIKFVYRVFDCVIGTAFICAHFWLPSSDDENGFCSYFVSREKTWAEPI